MVNTIFSNKTIFVLRHGQTKLNVQDAIRGWIDVPLNGRGIIQAHAAGRYLSKQHFDAVCISDLSRTVKTADLVMEKQKVAAPPLIIQTNGLRPINFGELQGRPKKEISKEHDDLMDSWKKDLSVIVPGGESFKDFQDRTYSFLETSLPPKGVVLIVTHMRVVLYIIALAMNNGKPLKGSDIDLMAFPRIICGDLAVIDDGHLAQLNPIYDGNFPVEEPCKSW